MSQFHYIPENCEQASHEMYAASNTGCQVLTRKDFQQEKSSTASCKEFFARTSCVADGGKHNACATALMCSFFLARVTRVQSFIIFFCVCMHPSGGTRVASFGYYKRIWTCFFRRDSFKFWWSRFMGLPMLFLKIMLHLTARIMLSKTWWNYASLRHCPHF